MVTEDLRLWSPCEAAPLAMVGPIAGTAGLIELPFTGEMLLPCCCPPTTTGAALFAIGGDLVALAYELRAVGAA